MDWEDRRYLSVSNAGKKLQADIAFSSPLVQHISLGKGFECITCKGSSQFLVFLDLVELSFSEDPLLFNDMEEIEIRLRVTLVQKKANRKLLSSQAEIETTEVSDLEEQTELTNVTLISEEVICRSVLVHCTCALFLVVEIRRSAIGIRRSSRTR